jgi:hypothetical protein
VIVSRNRMALMLAGFALAAQGPVEGATDTPRGVTRNVGRNEMKRLAAEKNGGRKRKHRLRARRMSQP